MNKIPNLLLILNIFINGGKKDLNNIKLNINKNIIIKKENVPEVQIEILKNNLIKQFKKYDVDITLEELKYIVEKNILNILLKKFNPVNLLKIRGYPISINDEEENKEFLNTIYYDIYSIIFHLNKSPFINNLSQYKTLLKILLKQDLIIFDNLHNIVNFLNESPLKDNLKNYSVILNKILKKDMDLDSLCKTISYLNESPLNNNLENYSTILNDILDNDYDAHQLKNILITLKNEYNKNLKDTLDHIKKI